MSSKNKTPNIGLNNWQGNEYAKREDFVNDNLIIDQEIKDLKTKTKEVEQSAKNYTDTEVSKKVDKISGKGLSTEDYTSTDKNKLAGIQVGANKYVHPSSHSLDMITETSDMKIMTNSERDKLNGIEDNANKYIHPATHSISKITETSTKKIMTSDERNKLIGIQSGAQVNRPISDSVSSSSTSTAASSKAVKAAYDRAVTALNTANTKETAFSKNTGFNLNKSDSATSTSTSTLATSKAVKTAYDKATTALNTANAKEPKITKKSGFNLNKSDSVMSTSTSTLATSKAVKTAYDKANQAFQSASDGKSKIASSITGMGQSASGSESFDTLSAKIKNISKDANAATSQVLSGKTFYQGGVKRTGTMPNRGSKTFTPSSNTQTGSGGYYSSVKVNPGLSYSVETFSLGRVYSCNNRRDKLYEHNPDTLTILKTVNSPNPYPSGIGGMKNRIYSCGGYEAYHFYEHNPDTLTAIKTVNSLNYPAGIGGMYNRLYSSSWKTKKLYEHNPDTLSIIKTVNSPRDCPAGIGGMYNRLYSSDGQYDDRNTYLYEHNPNTLIAIKTVKFKYANTDFRGIGGTENRLYGCTDNSYIVELNPDTLESIDNSFTISNSDLTGAGGIFPDRTKLVINTIIPSASILKIEYNSETYKK